MKVHIVVDDSGRVDSAYMYIENAEDACDLVNGERPDGGYYSKPYEVVTVDVLDAEDNDKKPLTNQEKIFNNINRVVEDYRPLAVESIKRNRHMNNVKLEEIDCALVEYTITSFTKFMLHSIKNNEKFAAESTSVSEMLEYLTSLAREMIGPHEVIKRDSAGYSPRIFAATLVDLINYVASRFCVDYGLYTRDIT